MRGSTSFMDGLNPLRCFGSHSEAMAGLHFRQRGTRLWGRPIFGRPPVETKTGENIAAFEKGASSVTIRSEQIK